MPVMSFQATRQRNDGGHSEPAPELLEAQGPIVPALLSIWMRPSKLSWRPENRYPSQSPE